MILIVDVCFYIFLEDSTFEHFGKVYTAPSSKIEIDSFSLILWCRYEMYNLILDMMFHWFNPN